jgi:hypothetical protein
MNWLPWVQMLGSALGTINPAAAALISMITGGVLTLQTATDEDKALIAQWQAFCQKIVDENRDPTEEEHAQARAFADQVHAANQSA